MERKRQQARRRLVIGPGDYCPIPDCNEADPLYLTRTSDGLICYEHLAIEQNRSQTEEHHPATRRVEPAFTVPIFGNDHRVVTVMSGRWDDFIKGIKDSALREKFGRFFALRDVERQMVERSGPVDQVVLDLLRWLPVAHPGWEKDLERWCASEDVRDP